MKTRCSWAGEDPLYVDYHDREWGVPANGDRTLFEFLVLEGAQAGLSWITILRKREAYRQAFAGFDPERVAAFKEKDLHRLQNDAGIVRNRKKIASAVNNARAFLAVAREVGSFSAYALSFVGGKPLAGEWEKAADIPAQTPESRALSADLKKRGFTFVGPVVCYSFMQAVGLVNDHVLSCFRRREILGG